MDNNQEQAIKLFLSNNKLTIGSTAYMVHKGFVGNKVNGAKIIPVKIKTFQRMSGRIEPVFYEIGSPKKELSISYYIPFLTIEEAKQAL